MKQLLITDLEIEGTKRKFKNNRILFLKGILKKHNNATLSSIEAT